MYSVTVKATDWAIMKQKLIEAADSIAPNGVVAHVTEEEDNSVTSMYDDAAVTAVVKQKVEPVLDQIANLPSFAPSSQTAPTSGGQTDSRGITWDERIHASSRNFNKDGTWRTRRGVDPAVVAQVEAELRTRQPAPSINPGNVPAPVAQVSTPVVQQAVPFAAPPVISLQSLQHAPDVSAPISPVQQPVHIAVAPSYDAVQVPPSNLGKPAHTLETFRQNFIPTMAQLVNQGSINQEYVNQLCQHFGVAQIWDIAKDEAKVAQLFSNFVTHGLITQVG